MSGTDLSYAATPCPVLAYRMVLRHVRYLVYAATAMSGTGLACAADLLSGTRLSYGATPCPVLTSRTVSGVHLAMSLRTRYYAVPGTHVAQDGYQPTRVPVLTYSP
eukprot:2169321-Rhodomonas_salina.3